MKVRYDLCLIFSRPASFSLDTVHGMLKQHKDVNKVKSLLRHNELAVDHDSRTHLWTLLCCSTLEKIVDETFQMYAGKFANGECTRYCYLTDLSVKLSMSPLCKQWLTVGLEPVLA